MQIKSIYIFKDNDSTGIDTVPVASLFQVNGTATTSTSWYYAKGGNFSSTTTISEMLLQTASYSRVGTATVVEYDYGNNDVHFKIKG